MPSSNKNESPLKLKVWLCSAGSIYLMHFSTVSFPFKHFALPRVFGFEQQSRGLLKVDDAERRTKNAGNHMLGIGHLKQKMMVLYKFTWVLTENCELWVLVDVYIFFSWICFASWKHNEMSRITLNNRNIRYWLEWLKDNLWDGANIVISYLSWHRLSKWKNDTEVLLWG